MALIRMFLVLSAVLVAQLIGNGDVYAIEYYSGSPYANTSTSTTLIQIQLKNTGLGQDQKLIVENSLFASFFAERHGTPIGEERESVINSYVPFMEAHEGRALHITLGEFTNWLVRRHNMDKKQAQRYVQQRSFVAAFTLLELGFSDRDELLRAMASQDPGGEIRIESRPNFVVDRWDPRFIALLLDLDFVVGIIDITGTMSLQKRTR